MTENVNNKENGGVVDEEIQEAYSVVKSVFENRIACEWLTTKEAAHLLGISENALRIMVHRGQVRVYKFGRRLRFKLKDCLALFHKKGA